MTTPTGDAPQPQQPASGWSEPQPQLPPQLPPQPPQQPMPFPPQYPGPYPPYFGQPYPPAFPPPPRPKVSPDAVWYVLPGFGAMMALVLGIWAAMLHLFIRLQDRAADIAAYGDGNRVIAPRHTQDGTPTVMAWSGGVLAVLALAGFIGISIARSKDKKRA